jgi:hypothetical protein
MPAEFIVTVESFAPKDAGREPTFEDRVGRLDWVTETDDATEYHDAQEFLPLDRPDVPFRPDAPITAGELAALATAAAAHGEIPGVDEEAPATQNVRATRGVHFAEPEAAGTNNEEEIPGVQDQVPGVPGPEGVQDQVPGVPGPEDEVPGVPVPDSEPHSTEEASTEEEEITVSTDSEYEPSNSSLLSSYEDDDGDQDPLPKLIPRTLDEENESDDEDEGGSNGSGVKGTQTTTKSGRRVRINRHLFDYSTN